ncbi:MAG: phage major capsid protein [Desulfitobacterium hafniense]|uniref:phage major capsid protein n=1 Tax=Desulfosporosinus sp. TaxID=157907 RepID=UPI00231426C2|nr:phage major capsid protein [Desulfosporosinus sp.]MCO5384432.1 phage major capsid protein [Desulfosporosinus sp.]MDA8227822.1 phage major capsid protein [Desulfitobacterium hafniense]
MSYTKEDLTNMLNKRDKYMATAVKVFEENTDENGDFKDVKNGTKEMDWLGLTFKINDSTIAIKNIAKVVAPDEDYSFLSDRISGIDGLRAAIEMEKKTPVNSPMYSSYGDSAADDSTKACLTPESKLFKNMFHNNNLSKGGFTNFNDFLKTVHSGRFDNRLGSPIKNSMTEGIPSEGGFSVPEEFTAWLLDNSLESEIVRPRAQVWPMKTDTKKIPGWDAKNHSSGLYGGLNGVWMAEAGKGERQKGKLRTITLKAKKLAIFTSVSNELLDDGLSFESQLGSAMFNTIGFDMDVAFFTGNGVGKPLGMLNDPALVTVSKEAGQAAGTILYDNLVKMFARIAPQCLSNSVWVVNLTAIPWLLTLSLAVGTGGSAVPVMSESNGVFKILSRPVIFTEKVPSVGTKGDISLVDWSQYAIGLRKEVLLDKSNAPGWTEDETDYRTILRVDGMGTWDGPIIPKNGNPLSWCVTLEDRK